jgi:hypothetical protein
LEDFTDAQLGLRRTRLAPQAGCDSNAGKWTAITDLRYARGPLASFMRDMIRATNKPDVRIDETNHTIRGSVRNGIHMRPSGLERAHCSRAANHGNPSAVVTIPTAATLPAEANASSDATTGRAIQPG